MIKIRICSPSFRNSKLMCLILFFLLLTQFTTQQTIDIIHYNDVYDVFKSPQFFKKVEAEKTGKQPLVLFSGDILSPSAASEEFKGMQFQKFLKKMGVQYAVPGNHENDFGYAYFIQFMKDNPDAAWIISNFKLLNEETKELTNLYGSEYRIIVQNKLRIGLMGLADKSWIGAAAKDGKIDGKTLRYIPFLEAARIMSTYLRTIQRCDLVFVLSHMNNDQDEAVLLDKTNSVDIVFGGHEHVYFVRKINNRLILKSGADFDYFSSIKLTIEEKPAQPVALPIVHAPKYNDIAGKDYSYLLDETAKDLISEWNFILERQKKVIKMQIKQIKVNPGDPQDADLVKALDTVKTKMPTLTNPVLYLTNKMDCRQSIFKDGEAPLHDFVSDVVRAWIGTEIACSVNHMLKSEMIIPGASIVNWLNVRKIFPYSAYHQIDIYELTLAELKTALEQSLVNFPEKLDMFMVCSGMSYKFKMTKKTEDTTTVNTATVTIQSPSDDKKKYKVGISRNFDKIYAEAVPALKGKKIDNGLKDPEDKLGIQGIVKDFLESANGFPGGSKTPNDMDYQTFKKTYPSVKLDDLVLADNVEATKRSDVAKTYLTLNDKQKRQWRYYTLATSLKEKDAFKFYELSYLNKLGRVIYEKKLLAVDKI